MSADSWGDLSPDVGFNLEPSKAAPSSAEKRRAKYEAGELDQLPSIEDSIYGERDFTIPGQGEQPDSCGRWFFDSFCEHGHLNLGRSRCDNRSCPDCWWRWSRQRAGKITRRLAAARHVAEEAADKRLIHAQLSPEPGSISTKRELYEGFHDVYELAQKHGIRGGMSVFHGYRATEQTKAAFARAKDSGKAEFGLWEWIRENERHWRDQVRWSPHWHVIGLARYEDVTPGDSEADDGWVFKNIRSLERFQLTQEQGYRDMTRASRYILSHLTFEEEESKHSVRWFGELSYQKFAPESETSAGAWRMICRYTDQVLGYEVEEEGQAQLEDFEDKTCDHDDCEGEVYGIWEAGELLQQKNFCDHIGRERQRRLSAAYKWSIGEKLPPPGARYPRSPAEAEESLQTII